MMLSNEFMTDKGKIEQVSTNFITNSIKYKKENEAPKIVIKHQMIGDRIIITFADNGKGIEKSFFTKVFTMFERGDNGEIEGTGVGLSIVKTIIERHGGEVWLDSEVGKGSEFHFSLPKKAA